eukprot:4528856-Lingulodinium_polyedra.AAC.1
MLRCSPVPLDADHGVLVGPTVPAQGLAGKPAHGLHHLAPAAAGASQDSCCCHCLLELGGEVAEAVGANRQWLLQGVGAATSNPGAPLHSKGQAAQQLAVEPKDNRGRVAGDDLHELAYGHVVLQSRPRQPA